MQPVEKMFAHGNYVDVNEVNEFDKENQDILVPQNEMEARMYSLEQLL